MTKGETVRLEQISDALRLHYEAAQMEDDYDLADYLGEALDAVQRALGFIEARTPND